MSTTASGTPQKHKYLLLIESSAILLSQKPPENDDAAQRKFVVERVGEWYASLTSSTIDMLHSPGYMSVQGGVEVGG